ncbi:hypothetical protein SELMODRAFT_427831 [Selaginella moellendorffii]|uniref:Uncharacterized protein n=1 Tax=Selaginella moellendorffii TaxID=88036 RepID=D8T0U8_SELML|nr:hypothetical protein SELMODRAFT_427831 [Selaginella moellendorffii]
MEKSDNLCIETEEDEKEKLQKEVSSDMVWQLQSNPLKDERSMVDDEQSIEHVALSRAISHTNTQEYLSMQKKVSLLFQIVKTIFAIGILLYWMLNQRQKLTIIGGTSRTAQKSQLVESLAHTVKGNKIGVKHLLMEPLEC